MSWLSPRVLLGAHLQTHVVGQHGEEMVLDVAADQRVSESPVQDWVSGQVEDSMAHLVDPLWSLLRREHGQTYVLWDKDKHSGELCLVTAWEVCLFFTK